MILHYLKQPDSAVYHYVGHLRHDTTGKRRFFERRALKTLKKFFDTQIPFLGNAVKTFNFVVQWHCESFRANLIVKILRRLTVHPLWTPFLDSIKSVSAMPSLPVGWVHSENCSFKSCLNIVVSWCVKIKELVIMFGHFDLNPAIFSPSYWIIATKQAELHGDKHTINHKGNGSDANLSVCAGTNDWGLAPA